MTKPIDKLTKEEIIEELGPQETRKVRAALLRDELRRRYEAEREPTPQRS